jgi:ketopantoate hydroxymethyltransferase
MSRSRNPWLRLTMDAWSLGMEASSVIALRTMKMAAGGAAADAEGQRMVSEKVKAGLELQSLTMMGGLGLTPQAAAARTLTHYRRKVRANQRRLLKG